MGKPVFSNQYSAIERQLIGRLAEIERQDQSRCDECGGEDCMCCEYYHDRSAWDGPEALFEGVAIFDEDEGSRIYDDEDEDEDEPEEEDYTEDDPVEQEEEFQAWLN